MRISGMDVAMLISKRVVNAFRYAGIGKVTVEKWEHEPNNVFLNNKADGVMLFVIMVDLMGVSTDNAITEIARQIQGNSIL